MKQTKKSLDAGGAANQGQILNQSEKNISITSPRLQRLTEALVKRPRSVRELVDIIPANNPAQYISILINRYGLTIFCERVNFVTVDGNKSWYGIYHLAPSDREKLREALEV